MASQPMPTPEQQPQGQPAAAPGGQQANPLQVALAQMAKVFEQLGQQNPIVQSECNQARQACVQALQKTMLASQAPAEQSPAPQGQ